MDKADAFEVAVRVIGLPACLRGVPQAISGVAGYYRNAQQPSRGAWQDYFVSAAFWLILGATMLVWAHRIAGLFYP